jgi:putative flippase GtrA
MVDVRLASAAAHPTVQQFLRFAAVGALGTLVHYSVLTALVGLAGVGDVAATSLGFLAGATATYPLNRRITFATTQPLGVTYVKYVVALSVGVLLNGAIVAGLRSLKFDLLIAQPIATGVVLFWNFGASRLLVFRPSA